MKRLGSWWDNAPPQHRFLMAVVFLPLALAFVAGGLFAPEWFSLSGWDRWITATTMAVLAVFFAVRAIRARKDARDLEQRRRARG